MSLTRVIASTVLLAGLAGPAIAAETDAIEGDGASIRLITAEDGVAPGATTLSAGLDVVLNEGWKTYWRSPGEVGLPPEIDWSASENVSDVEMLWPAPHRFRAFGIENYGYDERVVFPLRVTLEDPGAPARLEGHGSLLVCSDVCIPQDVSVALAIDEGTGIDDASAALIADHAARVPLEGDASPWRIGAAALSADGTEFVITATGPGGFAAPEVFPEWDGAYPASFGAPDLRLTENGLWAAFPVLSPGDPGGPIRVTLTDGTAAAEFAPSWDAAAPPGPDGAASAGTDWTELAVFAGIALLGGLLMNVMPCVLPVLSIKLGHAMKARGHGPARVRRGFLVSAAGVISFFIALAAVTLTARGAGLSLGWGLQFQSPAFLAVLIVCLAALAANLAGLFEIGLPSAWQTRLARADGAPGYGGDFATGALAAVLATPCTAPFLGTAVAFALAGSAVDVIVVFVALGIGLASPYLALAAAPGLLTRLPRPGRWMLLVKVALGAALALTVIWLLAVLSAVAGPAAAALVAALAALLVVLLWRGSRILPPSAIALCLAAILGAGVVLPPRLVTAAQGSEIASGIWTEFDRGKIARRVSEGDVVFVDVTADWCLTCQANKRLVLDRAEMVEALTAEGIVAMRADWTRPDPAISQYLETFGRYGIPFNAVYGPGAPEGIALPELLTRDAVLSALDAASGGRTQASN
ncbi:protein-disulfide reductase DsbD [Tropicimonas sp. IMCC34011]|uniref:protein-disulfide reductase DsbD family protein n=1 Tax=Tropicimonas sp. IMCC34011 TaxID=2248759 RepID=UPI001E5F4BF0|nr:protein-disulfide reductase DsbD domain-containing protein [Tropicimonas sp. IMCC34011]